MNLNDAWSALKQKVLGTTSSTQFELSLPDRFPLDPGSPHYATHRLVNEFYAAIPEPRLSYRVKPAQIPAARPILDAQPPELFLATEAILIRRVWIEREGRKKGQLDAVVCEFRGILQNVSSLLYRRNPCATQDQAAALISLIGGRLAEESTWVFDKDVTAMLRITEKLCAGAPPQESLRQALRVLKQGLTREDVWQSADRRRNLDQIERLLSQSAAASGEAGADRVRKPVGMDARDAWAERINEFVAHVQGPEAFAWDDLLAYARTATSSKPSGKWVKEAERLLASVGKEAFQQQVVDWLAEVRPTVRTTRILGMLEPPMSERNAELLKGLVWICAACEDARITQAVSHLAQACYRKIAGYGPLSAKVGNACLYTLSQLPGFEPIAQLSRLRLKVKYAVALQLIDRALQEAAEKLGMTTEELEEIAVPTYGLDETGCRREEFGDFTAELRITGTDSTELRWLKQDGKEQKSVPAQVKETQAEDWKELKRTIQDLEKMLPAQRDRIERLLVQEREWDYEKWVDRYHRHPLVSGLSRRLIWQFRQDDKTVLAAWHEGRFLDVTDQPVEWLSPATRVRLWHPLGWEVSVVSGWREWLERHQVTQPFKQAHREIYILTDAEIQTATYSNRFAAHIIKQHQFAALARQRGWKYTLQGNFDSHNTPFLPLPRLDLTAEFWVDPAGGTPDTSDMGIFLYLATDQVRFRDATGTARPLIEIPALILSEVMRDVDLFVGVCSVGNDPSWQDQGEAGRHMAYWRSASFGDLSAAAKTRRDVLQRLLPRLKIASKCRLEEKFLVVEGTLKTYKIHLGSANILMEANDRYLCIVPDRSSGTQRSSPEVFLPFEGDSTLAVILSKAFLLAEDTRIKDPTILNQIRA